MRSGRAELLEYRVRDRTTHGSEAAARHGRPTLTLRSGGGPRAPLGERRDRKRICSHWGAASVCGAGRESSPGLGEPLRLVLPSRSRATDSAQALELAKTHFNQSEERGREPIFGRRRGTPPRAVPAGPGLRHRPGELTSRAEASNIHARKWLCIGGWSVPSYCSSQSARRSGRQPADRTAGGTPGSGLRGRLRTSRWPRSARPRRPLAPGRTREPGAVRHRGCSWYRHLLLCSPPAPRMRPRRSCGRACGAPAS